jgi:hypothetical protein
MMKSYDECVHRMLTSRFIDRAYQSSMKFIGNTRQALVRMIVGEQVSSSGQCVKLNRTMKHDLMRKRETHRNHVSTDHAR